jgi:predicted Zn finger-like uncharacterized protein
VVVTCPGCAAKYRVRNETVPPDGARMRCPKCETLFLARPPTDVPPGPAEAGPAPKAATASPFAGLPVVAQHSVPAFVPSAPQTSGPLTQMMQAVAPAASPPDPPTRPAEPETADIVAPPPPTVTPRVRTHLTTPPSSSPASPPRAAQPSRKLDVVRWVAVAGGAVCLCVGTMFAAWTSESLSLDGAFASFCERRLGANVVVPSVRSTTVDDDILAAQRIEKSGDLSGAIVAWRRVAARVPDDAQALAAVPRITTSLGDRIQPQKQ